MNMQIDNPESEDGHVNFKLGKVERWVVAASVAVLVFLLGYVFNGFDKRLADQQATMQTVVTSQAVTNTRLETLSQQLANIPAMTSDIAELKVKVARNAIDIDTMRAARELRATGAMR